MLSISWDIYISGMGFLSSFLGNLSNFVIYLFRVELGCDVLVMLLICGLMMLLLVLVCFCLPSAHLYNDCSNVYLFLCFIWCVLVQIFCSCWMHFVSFVWVLLVEWDVVIPVSFVILEVSSVLFALSCRYWMILQNVQPVCIFVVL